MTRQRNPFGRNGSDDGVRNIVEKLSSKMYNVKVKAMR